MRVPFQSLFFRLTALSVCLVSISAVNVDPQEDLNWPGLYPPEDASTHSLMINIRPDDNPEQTSWFFEMRTDTTNDWTMVDQSSNYDAMDVINVTDSETLQYYSYLQANLTSHVHYRLRVRDSRGTGLCCENGWVSVTTNKIFIPTTNVTGEETMETTDQSENMDIFNIFSRRRLDDEDNGTRPKIKGM